MLEPLDRVRLAVVRHQYHRLEGFMPVPWLFRAPSLVLHDA